MKKYYFILIVLCFIIVGEGIIIFMNSDEKVDSVHHYINLPKEDDSNITNSNESLEDDMIDEYLSYVPYYFPLDFSVYFEDGTIEDVGQGVLIAIALTQRMDNYNAKNCEIEECGYYLDNPIEIQYLYEDSDNSVYGLYYFTFNYINRMLETMYGIRLSNLEETTSWDNTYAGAYGSFAFQNSYFLNSSSGIGESIYHVGFANDWVIEDDELIIYEIGAYWDTYTQTLNDYRNGYKIAIDADSQEEALDILKENQSSFTRYKHVFRKSDTGYYWYSTEAV